MKPITAILLGAGNRGMDSLAAYAERFPYELKFVAVAEPDEYRRSKMAEKHNIPASQCYETWEDVLAQPKLADMALICTQDRMHYEPFAAEQSRLDGGKPIVLDQFKLQHA